MINTAFNGMIAILIAKFMMNDLPHAAGLLTNSSYKDPPTPGQLRYIAILCQQLRITTPYEEQVRTYGEAGRMIRELEAERAHRKKQKKGNPTDFRIERTTTDQVLGDLEHTRCRITPDTSYEMLSALGILKEIIAYYYEEPCVVVWDDSSLVGAAVYETTYDRDKGILNTLIKELASFTHKPSVGRLLVEEVLRIGREENADIVSASYGPGAMGFYEKLGFVKDVYYPDEPTLVMYRLKSSNPVQYGTCYSDAYRYTINQKEGYLIHGSILRGNRINHAWVELPTGYIWEPHTGEYYTISGFDTLFKPEEHHRYSVEQAAIMATKTGNMGPWAEEE